jgi:hypothetical protein
MRVTSAGARSDGVPPPKKIESAGAWDESLDRISRQTASTNRAFRSASKRPRLKLQ